MTVPLGYSLRSLWVRRTTTLATVSGVALVVFVVASSQMLAAGLRRTLGVSGSDDRVIVLQQNATAESYSRLEQSALSLATAAPGVRMSAAGTPLAVGESVVQTMLPRADAGGMVSVFIRGVTPTSFQLHPAVRMVEGRPPEDGADEAVIGRRLTGRFDRLHIGGDLELKPGRKIQVVGVFEADGSSFESEVWANLEAVRTSLSWEGYLASITVQLESPERFDDFASEVTMVTSREALAERESDYYRRISRGLSSMFVGLGTSIAAIFSVASMLGAAITMYSSVGQRTKELGVLRALGFSKAHILAAFLLETGALSALGATFGIIAALLASLLELSTMNGTTGAQLVFRFEPSALVLIGSFVVGTCVGLIGGLFPAIRASRMDPIEAMRA